MPMVMLHSPAHPLVSGRYAIIEFTGRKSGRVFRTPVAYVRDGSRVLLSTDSPWWRNLTAQPTVRLRLKGRELTGQAHVVSEPTQAAAILRRLVESIRGYSRPAGVATTRGRVSEDELTRALTSGGRRTIVVQLDAA